MSLNRNSFHLRAFDKVIPCPLTYLYFVLNKAEESGDITSAPNGRGPTRVSNLFLEDDILLLYQAKSEELTRLLRYWTYMNKPQDRFLIKKGHLCFSIRILIRGFKDRSYS